MEAGRLADDVRQHCHIQLKEPLISRKFEQSVKIQYGQCMYE
jgi:hypothetical protein